MWKADRKSEKPLYLQIVDELERKINLVNSLKEKFPSERKLAEQSEVNRSTVVLAYDEDTYK